MYMDKVFLMKYMRRFCEHLHYRIIDVSSVKELAIRWMPAVLAEAPRKGLDHRAMNDILESIAELKYYRTSIFLPR